MNYTANNILLRQNKVRNNLGFRFALWCAILWGACYHVLGFLVVHDSFLGTSNQNRNLYMAGIAIALVLGIMIFAISLLWSIFTCGANDFCKTAFRMNKISKFYMMAAIAGTIAACASCITAGMVNTHFSVISVMFYPLVGYIIAKKWFKEKITSNSKIGLFVIILGGFILYVPVFWNFSDIDHSYLPYILGLITGLGWGIDAVMANKALNLHDCTTAVAIRYFYEFIIWAIVLIALFIFAPTSIICTYIIAIVSDPLSLALLFVVALCRASNYMSWYRAFALIGVFNCLVISDISGFIVVVIGMFLAFTIPSWAEIFSAVIMLLGVFIVYNGSQTMTVLRDVDIRPKTKKSNSADNYADMPLKTQALRIIEKDGPIWDYDVADMLSDEIVSEKRRKRSRDIVRSYLIEARTAGIITSAENKIDISGCFAKGKLLSKYQVTEYGYDILRKYADMNESER